MITIPEYHTSLEPIKLKEYGRNVQRIAKHIAATEDDDKRSQMAYSLIELMKQLNPNVRENQDYQQRIWNHLYHITDFTLEIKDPPFPVPTEESVNTKPLRVEYSSNRINYKHYGRNVELLIEKAIAIEDPKEKEDVVIYLGKVMKRFYYTWNKDSVDDEIIVRQIKKISEGKLEIDLEMVKEKKLFDSMLPTKSQLQQESRSNSLQSDRRRNNNNNNKKRRRK